MSKRDLLRKYEETFGAQHVLLYASASVRDLWQFIDSHLVVCDTIQSSPLNLSKRFMEAFARAHLALDQIIEMMGPGEKQEFLTRKHYLLNDMEMEIREK